MNRQEELLTIHYEVAKAIEELTQNRDSYAAVGRLAAALEMVLNFLEQEHKQTNF
jgi:hypothetical protein